MGESWQACSAKLLSHHCIPKSKAHSLDRSKGQAEAQSISPAPGTVPSSEQLSEWTPAKWMDKWKDDGSGYRPGGQIQCGHYSGRPRKILKRTRTHNFHKGPRNSDGSFVYKKSSVTQGRSPQRKETAQSQTNWGTHCTLQANFLLFNIRPWVEGQKGSPLSQAYGSASRCHWLPPQWTPGSAQCSALIKIKQTSLTNLRN